MKVQPIHKLKDIKAIKKLISGSPRDFAIFAIGINTNLRASDIIGLTIGQVRRVKPASEIEIIEKKTKKNRRITINEEAATAIQRLLGEYSDRYKDEDRLFQGQRGPLTVKTVTQLVKKWCGHQRTMVGTPIPELMVMLNHICQKQTLDYLRIQPEGIKSAYVKLSY